MFDLKSKSSVDRAVEMKTMTLVRKSYMGGSFSVLGRDNVSGDTGIEDRVMGHVSSLVTYK